MTKSFNASAINSLVTSYQKYAMQAIGHNLTLTENSPISKKLSLLLDICEKKTQALPPLKNFLEDHIEVLALMSQAQCLGLLHLMAQEIPSTTKTFNEDHAKLLLFIAKILENNYQLDQHPLLVDFLYERLIANEPYNGLLTFEAKLNLSLKVVSVFDHYIDSNPKSPQKEQLLGRKRTILTTFFKSQKQFNIELSSARLGIDTQAKLGAFTMSLLFSFFQSKNTTYFENLYETHQNVNRILFQLRQYNSPCFQTMLAKLKIRANSLDDFFLSITEALDQPQQALFPALEDYFSHLKKLAKMGILTKILINKISSLYTEIFPGLHNQLPNITNLEVRIGKTKDLLYLDLARHVSYILSCHLNPANFYGAYDDLKYTSMLEALSGYMNAEIAFTKLKIASPVLQSYRSQVKKFVDLMQPFAHKRKQSQGVRISPTTEVLCQNLVLQNPEIFLQRIGAIEEYIDRLRIGEQQRIEELRTEAESLAEPKKKIRKKRRITQQALADPIISSEAPRPKTEEKQKDPIWLKTMKKKENWFTTYNKINTFLIKGVVAIQQGKHQAALFILKEAQNIFTNQTSQINAISNENFYIYLLVSRFEVESLILSTLLKETTIYINTINQSTAEDPFTQNDQLLTNLSLAFLNTKSCAKTISDYFKSNVVNEELTITYEIFNNLINNFTHQFENKVNQYKQAHENLSLKIINLEQTRLKILEKLGEDAWRNNPNPKGHHAAFGKALKRIKDESDQQIRYMDEAMDAFRSRITKPEEIQLETKIEEIPSEVKSEEITPEAKTEEITPEAKTEEITPEAKIEVIPPETSKQKPSELLDAVKPNRPFSSDHPPRRVWSKKPSLFCTNEQQPYQRNPTSAHNTKPISYGPRRSSSFFKKNPPKGGNPRSPISSIPPEENLWTHFRPIATSYLKLLQKNNLDFLYAQRTMNNDKKGKIINIYVNCSEEKLTSVLENRPPLRFSVIDFGETFRVRFISMEKLAGREQPVDLKQFRLPQKIKRLELVKTNNGTLLQHLRNASAIRIIDSSEEGEIHTLQLQANKPIEKTRVVLDSKPDCEASKTLRF